MVTDLAPLGDVTSRKMFGGYGVFESGVMFALVDSGAKPHFRVGDANEAQFVDAGSEKFERMPYWTIPTDVLDDDGSLVEWGAGALAVARAAKQTRSKKPKKGA